MCANHSDISYNHHIFLVGVLQGEKNRGLYKALGNG